MSVRLLVLALLLTPLEAAGHSRSVSYSSWDFDASGARVTLSLSQLELTRLPFGPLHGGALDPDLARYVTQRVQLLADGQPCAVTEGPRALVGPPERAILEWRVSCPPGGGAREIRSGFLLEPAPGHLHFARVRTSDGPALERVLTAAEPGWRVDVSANGVDPASAGSSFTAYLWLGVEHIGTGYDHLAFLLALLLVARRLGEVALLVTGFTLAHSATLALAVLGFVEPRPGAVEALIGLSIALAAAEDGWLLSGRSRAVPLCAGAGLAAAVVLAWLGRGSLGAGTLAGVALFCVCYFGLLQRVERPDRLRVALAFAFGLVHGFGFAGVLHELELPAERLVPALLGFNLGVELGQLAAIALLWPLLRGLARLRDGVPARLAVEAAAAGVCGLGLFWFATRAYA